MVNLAIEAGGFDYKTREELGKALADRFGLQHEVVNQDWTSIEGHGNTVWVNFRINVRMTGSEFNELFKVAQERAAQR